MVIEEQGRSALTGCKAINRPRKWECANLLSYTEMKVKTRSQSRFQTWGSKPEVRALSHTFNMVPLCHAKAWKTLPMNLPRP